MSGGELEAFVAVDIFFMHSRKLHPVAMTLSLQRSIAWRHVTLKKPAAYRRQRAGGNAAARRASTARRRHRLLWLFLAAATAMRGRALRGGGAGAKSAASAYQSITAFYLRSFINAAFAICACRQIALQEETSRLLWVPYTQHWPCR